MRILILVASLILAACDNGSGGGGSSTAPLESKVSQERVESVIDGTNIAFTAYFPELAAGETAPLLIHGQSWGNLRVSNLDDDGIFAGFSQQESSVKIAKRAWEAGYFVITYDPRGFGDSEGQVSLADPNLDGQDIKSIIDWAVENFGEHLAQRGDDPVVGTLGLSYGAGTQLANAGVDERVDAMVPMYSWYDLAESLAPNGVPKSTWASLLVASGTTSSGFSLPFDLYTSALSAFVSLELPEDLATQLHHNSLASFCDGDIGGRNVPNVDALFVQGAHDVLFNANEAIRSQACLKDAGNDSRLLIQRDGHIIPLLQESGSDVFFGLQETVHCGERSFNTESLIFEFLEEKLRNGVPSQAPTVCFSQAETGQALPEVPIGGVTGSVQENRIPTGLAFSTLLGLFFDLNPSQIFALLAEAPRNLIDLIVNGVASAFAGREPAEIGFEVLSDLLNVIPPELLQELITYQYFMPIAEAQDGQALAGVPTASLSIENSLIDLEINPLGIALTTPIVYVGVAVEPADGSGRYLVNDQITPIRGTGEHDIWLAGVNAKLEEGDRVGLVVMPFHPQFASSRTRVPGFVNVSGSASLPIIADQQ